MYNISRSETDVVKRDQITEHKKLHSGLRLTASIHTSIIPPKPLRHSPSTKHTQRIHPHNPIQYHGLRVDKGMILSGAFAAASAFFWLFFATAYTIPAKNPTETAETDPKDTGSPKKIIPEAATGSLFSAPTILYHVRKHPNKREKQEQWESVSGMDGETT